MLQILQHLGLVWRAPAFSGFHVQGVRALQGMQISFSLLHVTIKAVWLCVSWKLIFLSLCLLISSNYSLFTLD